MTGKCLICGMDVHTITIKNSDSLKGHQEWCHDDQEKAWRMNNGKAVTFHFVKVDESTIC